MKPHERFGAWLLTGPVGRFVAFFADLGVYWWRWARGKLGMREHSSKLRRR